MTEYVIIGSGMAGFGAASFLNHNNIKSTVLEKNSYYGGHTSTHKIQGGWTFDEGPHISFTKDKRIEKLLAKNIDNDFYEVNAKVNNYWQGKWIAHPAQVHLYGLDANMITKIITELFELKTNIKKITINNYEDWLFASFGETFSRNFPIKYTKKYHTTEAKNLSTSWIGDRIYIPSIEEVIKGSLTNTINNVHYIPKFRYPKFGGFVSYLRNFQNICNLKTNHKVVSIDVSKNEICLQNGQFLNYKKLISSMPLPELISVIKDVPSDVKAAAKSLACTELITVTLGINRSDLIDAHWTYFYDDDISFTRLSTPHLQSVNNAPKNCGMLQAECYFSKKYLPYYNNYDKTIESVIYGLKECGIIKPSDKIIFKNIIHTDYANIIFDHDTEYSVNLIHGYLDDLKINYCGRYGNWAYIWTDESFISGENAAMKCFNSN